MKLGFIGLGRMGKNMVINLLEHKHQIVVWNRAPDKIRSAVKEGAIGTYSIENLCSKLGGRKVVWIMVSAGKAVDEVINELKRNMSKGDIIIDGGNSDYRDSQRRYDELKKLGIKFIDCGVSGGVEGARNGACMMIGGDKNAFEGVEKIFKDMCVKGGYGYVGKSGAGHFVKMIHNGIEYGMIGALAEGFNFLDKNKIKFGIELDRVAKIYSNGSIIEGKLMSLLDGSLKRSKNLNESVGEVSEGETEEEMKELVKKGRLKILNQAIKMREETRKKHSFSGKVISVLRKEFGGHEFRRK